MDNLTHTLVAVALSRAGLERVTRHATLLLIIAANLPDIDLLGLVRGSLTALELHRGYTHSLVALPVLAIVSVALTAMILRERIALFRSLGVALIGLGSHLLLDWTGSFGIRALLPFSSKWFYLDLNGFYDGVLLTVLGLSFFWPRFVGLVSSEMGRNIKHPGQGSAILALLFMAFYVGGRWTLQQRAWRDLSVRRYDAQTPLRVSVLGEPNNPFAWTGVIETEDSFRLVRTGSMDFDESTDARVFRKPPKTPLYAAVMEYEPFRYMAYFSRFPVWDIEPESVSSGVGQRVDLTDLRFGTPGAGEFHASALADAGGRVLETRFCFSNCVMPRP